MKSTQRFQSIAAGALMLLATTAVAAGNGGKPETPILSQDAYRTPLDQVIVTGRQPQQAPRWDKPKVEIPQQTPPSRMQFLPQYTRDERDDVGQPRDPSNPPPRTKLFELKF